MCLVLMSLPRAQPGFWFQPESEKGESKSRVLILQVSVNIWFVDDSVAGTRALGFILHACFRNTTEFRLMESFSIEIFFYSFPSILSHFWQVVVIANGTTWRHWISRISMWKSQKSSQRTFFIQPSHSELKLPLMYKKMKYRKWLQARLAAK